MNNFKKVLSVVLIGGTILSFSTIALASTRVETNGNSTVKTVGTGAGKGFRGDLKGSGTIGVKEDNLAALVTAGILTQAEADKITALEKQEAEARQAEREKVKNMTADERKAYFETKKTQQSQVKTDIFSRAVTSGILTQTKADAARAKLQEIRTAERNEKLTTSLKELVTKGTITQAQADKVLAYIKNLQANKPAVDNTSKDATKGEKTNPLSALVQDGTLTQEQLDAICKVIPFGRGHGHGKHGGMKPTNTNTNKATTNSTSSI